MQIAVVGVLDAEETLLKRKRVLGEMLNLSPDEARAPRGSRSSRLRQPTAADARQS